MEVIHINSLDQIFSIYDKVANLPAFRDCPTPFFRGQADERWPLEPALARLRSKQSANEIAVIENTVFLEFETRGAPHIEGGLTSWETLAMIRHYGLPTRLLDWSESFSVALFFALRERGEFNSIVIWCLNPWLLNEMATGRASLFTVDDGEDSYRVSLITGKFSERLQNNVAIAPMRSSPRIHAQQGMFTFHGDLHKPLDVAYPNALLKLVISKDAFGDAEKLLFLAGIHEYSLFPDLEGLTRHFRAVKKNWF